MNLKGKIILPALLLGALLLGAGCGEETSVSDRVDELGLGSVPDPTVTNVLIAGQTNLDGMAAVQTYLTPFGFPVLDTFDNNSGTPTLAQLQNYDVVILWSNSSFSNATLFGDNLADYVDSGGGVVLAAFAHHAGTSILGRIISDGYSPYNIDGSGPFSNQNVGSVDQPGHPIMENVVTLNAYYRSAPTMAAGGISIANFDNGAPMVAVTATGNVVGLEVIPPDPNRGGDFETLVANTLAFAAWN
ncbi:MAG: hypothetical protein FVQ81_18095 [Candidatus Glassbacteria bacterium]|nr:hypothetical protein [Candidatus Glassbacteria bacterium]